VYDLYLLQIFVQNLLLIIEISAFQKHQKGVPCYHTDLVSVSNIRHVKKYVFLKKTRFTLKPGIAAFIAGTLGSFPPCATLQAVKHSLKGRAWNACHHFPSMWNSVPLCPDVEVVQKMEFSEEFC